MRRRDVLTGAGLTASATFGITATPTIAKGIRRLTMVTDWPEESGMMDSARQLALSIEAMSGGQLEIRVFASGALVRPFETFDAARNGVADMFHSHVGYFSEQARTLQFFSGLPFGMTPNELFAWVHAGNGQSLWDELGITFGIKPLLCCNTGTQMGGWFKEELASVENLRGLRYRMAGLGGEVFRRLGAAVILLPAADIVQALRSGAIDASEWVGPWLDSVMGLPSVAKYYYYPGWHEPSGAITLGINKRIWEELGSTEKRIFEVAAAAEHGRALAEFDRNNAQALRDLRSVGAVELRRFDDDMLKAFAEISADVVAEAGSGDALARRIHASYSEFLSAAHDWSEIGEGAYLYARSSAVGLR